MNEHNKKENLSNEEVEYRIAKAVVSHVPDICEQASSTPVTPLTMVDDIVPRQYPRKSRALPRLLAACLLLVLMGASFGAYTWFSVKAILSIEVNPSVSLSVNRYERVIDAHALNDDADDLLEELTLKGLKLDTALDALMGAMNRKGYLQDGGNIRLFVDGKDERYNQELYEDVSEQLSHIAPNMVTAYGEEQDAPAAGTLLSQQELKQIALDHAGLDASQVTFHDISMDSDENQKVCRLSFYTEKEEYDYQIDAVSGEILAFDHDIEDFALQTDADTATQELPSDSSTPPPSDSSKSSTPSNPSPSANQTVITPERAKQLAVQKAGLDAGAVVWEKVELDEDDDVLVYELEFSSGSTEYQCDIEAYSGTILKLERESDD